MMRIFILLTLTLTLALPSVVSASVGEACVGSVRLGGTSDSVEQVAAALVARGVDTSPPPSCSAVAEAELSGEPPELSMRIRDVFGRVAERTASDPEMAATFVETWIQAAEVDPSPLPSKPPAQARVKTPDRDLGAAPAVSTVSTPAAAPAIPTIQLRLSPEIALSDDRGLWLGASLSACIPLGAMCVGARARVAADSGQLGLGRELRSERRLFELLLHADLPYTVGPVTLTPGLEAGMAFHLAEEPGRRSPEQKDGGLRLGAYLGAELPLGSHFALAASLGAGGFFGPVHGPIELEGASVAGAPRGFARAGLSLGYQWR